MKLHGHTTRVLVTGATGFIGARLVEVLASVRGVEVVALVRDFARVARIARFGVRLQRGDLLDVESLRRAVQGVDVVFHCAYDSGAGGPREREINVTGTLNLAREARGSGIKRFVYTSSMAVYGHDLPPIVSEQTPYRPSTAYGRIKRDAELALRQYGASNGLSIVVVQPTKVYGPYDFGFTVPVVRKLVKGELWLIENGSGLVTPAYVDNVVHGLILSAEKDGVDGQVFILADSETLRWAEFYERLAGGTYAKPYGTVGLQECEKAWKASSRGPGLPQLLAATILSPEARRLYPRFRLFRLVRGLCPDLFITALKSACLPRDRASHTDPAQHATPPKLPGPQEYRDFTRRGAFSIARARQELGYEPRVSLAEGLQRATAWLRFAHIIPSDN